MDHVRVLSTLALMGAVRDLATQAEAEAGTRIDADFGPTVALLKRLENGETADIVILTQQALADLAANGSVVADSCVDLAHSYVGLAVKAGAAQPDIASPAALRTTLLSARSIAYSRIGASGIFFAQLIEQMGIAAEINARACIVPTGFTAERLVSGEADVAIQQISELKLVPGIDVVGPLPLKMQTPMTFSAGRMTGSSRAAQADRLLTFLTSERVVAALRKSGLER